MVRVKSISGKYSIFRKCYFPERKMFSCVWLHFKKIFEKYFLVFGKEEGRDKTQKNMDKTQKKKIIKSGQIERRRKRERRLGSTRGEIARRRRRRDRRGASRDHDRREGEITIDGAIFHLCAFARSFFLFLVLPLRVCELSLRVCELSLRVSVPEII